MRNARSEDGSDRTGSVTGSVIRVSDIRAEYRSERSVEHYIRHMDATLIKDIVDSLQYILIILIWTANSGIARFA